MFSLSDGFAIEAHFSRKAAYLEDPKGGAEVSICGDLTPGKSGSSAWLVDEGKGRCRDKDPGAFEPVQ